MVCDIFDIPKWHFLLSSVFFDIITKISPTKFQHKLQHTKFKISKTKKQDPRLAAAHAQQHAHAHQAERDRLRLAMAQQHAAAHAQQAHRHPQSSHEQENGSMNSIPQHGWEYVDPRGQKQGPFVLTDMITWHGMGFFKTDLPMRWHSNMEWVPFSVMFPDPITAFRIMPRTQRKEHAGGVNAGRQQ